MLEGSLCRWTLVSLVLITAPFSSSASAEVILDQGADNMGDSDTYALPYDDLIDESPDLSYTPQEEELSVAKRPSYGFGIGRRSHLYGFGVGKRDAYDLGLEKRSSYGFGLGKRDPSYGFGLGKKSASYGFGLGKRDPSYGFGLGKRQTYGFGLGKRSWSTWFDGPSRDKLKRPSYGFGLGKRSAPPVPESYFTPESARQQDNEEDVRASDGSSYLQLAKRDTASRGLQHDQRPRVGHRTAASEHNPRILTQRHSGVNP